MYYDFCHEVMRKSCDLGAVVDEMAMLWQNGTFLEGVLVRPRLKWSAKGIF